MTTEATPGELGSTEVFGLVPCPLCGASKGYTLDEGSTYRWWSVCCADCGQEVSEARATYPAETTARTAAADTAWNSAGAHAQGLRDEIERLRAEVAVLRDANARWSTALAAERERYAPLMQAVEWLLEEGHMDTEHLARLRAAWERA